MTASTFYTEQQACFQFKASFLPCTVLQLIRYDLIDLAEQLNMTIRRAPKFFIGSPVVVDLDKIKTFTEINFSKLKEMLTTSGLIPIGVRGGTEEQQEAAMQAGFSMIMTTKLSTTESEKNTNPEIAPITKLIKTPIRSGMQVYAKQSDLIVMSAVSPGAELFADGNIHVYGPLRGRALAGVQGNIHARIFCRELEAELVSIAGYYLTKEDMPTFPSQSGMIQIFLENLKVRIEII